MENNLVNIGLIIAYILLGITIIAAIILPFIYFVKNFNFAKAKNSFISIFALLIIFFITYLISSGKPGQLEELFGISPIVFRLIGGSLITTYILTIVALLISVYSEATNRFK